MRTLTRRGFLVAAGSVLAYAAISKDSWAARNATRSEIHVIDYRLAAGRAWANKLGENGVTPYPLMDDPAGPFFSLLKDHLASGATLKGCTRADTFCCLATLVTHYCAGRPYFTVLPTDSIQHGEDIAAGRGAALLYDPVSFSRWPGPGFENARPVHWLISPRYEVEAIA